MPRLDVDEEEEALPQVLNDVYNEWRRHISCQLDTDDDTQYIGIRREWMDGSRSMNRKQPAADAATEDRGEVDPATISLLVENAGSICVNAEENLITLSDGSMLTFDKCLLAPPGKPRELYVLKSSLSFTLREKINALRDHQDFNDLYREVKSGGRTILVVGGGFLGTSICASLLSLNDEVDKPNKIVQTFVETSPLQQYFPDYLATHVMMRMQGLGLQMISDTLVTGVARSDDNAPKTRRSRDDEGDDCARITFMKGAQRDVLDADLVVLASTNVDPDVEVAKASELEIDSRNGGIVVNSSLEAFDGIFVAGSAASYFDASLNRRRRNDFYDNALNSGLVAGQNMVSDDGRLHRYMHQPTFRCSLPGTGLNFEAVGEINSNLPTHGIWLSKRDEKTGKPVPETDFERGIVFYLRNNVVVGVLCCNACESLDVARDLLRTKNSIEEATKLIMLAPNHWIQTIKTK